jgi:K(+)-stimulated pyrophosphate-energized sodium pump
MVKELWLLALASAFISIIVGILLYFYVSKQDSGTTIMVEISSAIKEGADAFLKREFTVLSYFVAVVAFTLSVFISPIMGVTYVLGAVCSALSGYFGMQIALKANVRTANAAITGLNKAFSIAFRGGAVMGLSVVGMALLGVSVVYGFSGDPLLVLGFSFGASAMALFAKAGGGIYTKTADVGADLVGKVEMDIPEDDPRNPAVIADNVGDNVGDVAGMGADLFDSYVASIVAAMILAGAGIKDIPLIYAGLGILCSIVGIATVRVGKKGNPGKALNWGTYFTCFLFAASAFVLTNVLNYNLGIWVATTVGLLAGIVIGITTDYYTSIDRSPAIKTAESSQTGAAINIITGFSHGLISMFPPLIGIGIASASSFFVAEYFGVSGLFGVSMSAIGMLSIVAMIIAGDAFGPISDNAKGIAEQAGLSEKIVDVADRLDAAGNTAKAITKGFAIGAAGLTVIALLATFQELTDAVSFDLMNPKVLTGAFVGIAVPPLFSALLMLGVGKNAFLMIKEVRRQFREISGLKEGIKGIKPDYARCVDIATIGALKELLPASVIAIVLTLSVGFIGGIEALGGFLGGSIMSGLLFALLMANSGGLWDNAKKYIEAGAFGGKGSEAHKAAVIGDTVGDPFKDTAGPSLNTLITVMSLVASVFADLILRYNLIALLGL